MSISQRRAALYVVMSVMSVGLAATQERTSPASVHVNGFDMAYRIVGAGEPLLLRHGIGGCGDTWDPFVPALSKRFQLIIPDLRGHGRSTNPSKLFTHSQSAADVLALLDELKRARVRAMGISTGGMTLLHLATRAPDRVSAMVLIGATSYFPAEARAIMVASRGQTPPEVLEQQRACAKRGDQQLQELRNQFFAFKDSYDDMNFTPPYLATIKARTLIVHGDRDPFFPVRIPVEMYQSIPGAELWIVPGDGHVPIFGPRQSEFETIAIGFLEGGR
jgi:pimeloyl-ACP methyl ester carboxylesterase